MLMVLAGPSYGIIWCNVGVNGRVSDGEVWNQTGLGNSSENEEINLPVVEPLPNKNRKLPLRNFRGRCLCPETVFDEALSSARPGP